MNNTKASGSEHVNFKLQKTISNLISNVISSLCQQFIRYEHSVDIFGLLSINIDEDVDISVKLNEKFIKKDMIGNSTNFDCTNLLETIKKNGDQKQNVEHQNNVSEDDNCNKMETDEIEKESTLMADDNEKDLSFQKRRPRKPQQTFRHFTEDESQGNKGTQKLPSPISDGELKDLKIDTQYQNEMNNAEIESSLVEVVDRESIGKSNETDECEEKPQNLVVENKNTEMILDTDNKEQKTCKPNAVFKCSICDRQFKRKFCLTRHKRVHQNFKSYNCNMCGLGFDLVNQLKRHMRNMHLYNRENLRRSCRTNQKIEDCLPGSSEAVGSQEYSWSSLNTLPIYSTCIPTTSSTDSQQIQSKPTSFAPFPYPPGLVVSQSGKKPISNTLTNTFTPPSSIPNHYQIRQLFNSIIPGSDASFPYNNSMYFVQNYPPILPATNQNLYPPSVSNSKVPTTAHIPGISNSNLQRLPIYRFSPGLLNSPSLKSMPLTNRNWAASVSSSDTPTTEKPKTQAP